MACALARRRIAASCVTLLLRLSSRAWRSARMRERARSSCRFHGSPHVPALVNTDSSSASSDDVSQKHRKACYGAIAVCSAYSVSAKTTVAPSLSPLHVLPLRGRGGWRALKGLAFKTVLFPPTSSCCRCLAAARRALSSERDIRWFIPCSATCRACNSHLDVNSTKAATSRQVKPA